MLLIFVIACVGAGATYLIGGPLEREPKCDPAEIGAGEVCLETVVNEWEGKILWIDARARENFDKWHYEGALLINNDPNENFDEMLAGAVEGLTSSDKVVVYCAKKGCDASKEIAERLRGYDFGPSVYTLYGGVASFGPQE